MTTEQIARNYAAAMDSVNLINAGKPAHMSDTEWADCLKRNKDHLLLQVAKSDVYAGYDMQPLIDASA